MKVKALKTVNWSCNDNLYKCEVGKELEIASADADKAKASGLFEEVKTVKKTTTKGK